MQWGNKKGLCPTDWDKSLSFCGTTQIDVKRPLVSYTENICSIDNGRRSRQALLGNSLSSCPPESIHKSPALLRSHHPQLSERGKSSATLLSHRFYSDWFYYSEPEFVCQGFFQNFFAAFRIWSRALEEASQRIYSRASSSVRRICSSITSR